jgi:predicted outer membrane repeat protein
MKFFPHSLVIACLFGVGTLLFFTLAPAFPLQSMGQKNPRPETALIPGSKKHQRVKFLSRQKSSVSVKTSTMSSKGNAVLSVNSPITVNSTSDATAYNASTSDTTSTGVITLRSAIQFANMRSGVDTIKIPPGQYYLTLTGIDEDAAATGDLDINDDLVIIGTGGSSPTTSVYGDGSDRVFDIDPTNAAINVTINSLVITQGRATNNEDGGGLLVHGGTLELDSVSVDYNAADAYGGGIAIYSGTLTMNYGSLSYNTADATDGGGDGGGADVQAGTSAFSHVSISGNLAAGGAGIENGNSGADISIDYCTFTADSVNTGYANWGGAISNDAGNLTIDHSTFTYNYSVYHGGAIALMDGTHSIANSLIEHNATGASSAGGGIYHEAVSLAMINDTVRWNAAPSDGGGMAMWGNFTYNGGVVQFDSSGGSGGGIYVGTGTDTIADVTIHGNSATTDGGGIYSYGVPTYPLLTLTNVVVDSNTAGGKGGGFFDGPGGTNWTGGALTNNIAGSTGGGLFFGGGTGDDNLSDMILAGNVPDSIHNNIDISHHVYLSNVTLPVELASFTAGQTGNAVTLKWVTATEVNNFGFNIERKDETNPTWTKIAFVEGSGTSNAPHTYSFIDRSLLPGQYAYRIAQVDRTGALKYSKEMPVDVASAPRVFALSQNYPNPFNPTTTIEFTLPSDGRVVLKVYDLTGREVATLLDEERKAGVYQQVVFDASRLASGVYFARLQFGGKQLLKKMLLLK